MEDEDFNFDDFMENSNRDFEKNLKDYQERMMLIAIEANYASIEMNGISEWHLRHISDIELKDLTRTFQIMMDHYESIEEYEKCAVILKEKHKIEKVMSLKNDI